MGRKTIARVRIAGSKSAVTQAIADLLSNAQFDKSQAEITVVTDGKLTDRYEPNKDNQ